MQSLLAEVKRVNDILDSYELPSAEDDCESKIDELSEIMERLVHYGFNKSFVPKGMAVPKDTPPSEKREIKRQLRELRYIAFLKKSTLRRVEYAMASYRVAALHFKSGALGNAYRHLPYDGNLILRISRLGATAARLYFDIYELLSGEIEQLGISVDVAIPSEEGVKYEKLQLYGVRDVDDYVADMYGESAEIVKTKIITRHKSVLTSRAYRKVLACAYAVNTVTNARIPQIPEDETHELLHKYMGVLGKYGIREPVRADLLPDIKEEMVDELQKENLVYFDSNGEMCLHDELGLKLNETINRRYWEYAKDAYGKIATDMIRHIMLTTRATRREMGIFSFDDDLSLVEPIIQKAGLSGMSKAGEMVENKMVLESTFSSSDKKLGLAVFAYYQGRKMLKEVFDVEFRDVEEDYKLIKAFLERGGGRGVKFLEHLKK